MKTLQDINFTCINGNYVCHFLDFINDDDREKAKENTGDLFGISTLYAIAVKKAHKIGGKRYHNKKYGGGIMFTTGGREEIIQKINSIL